MTTRASAQPETGSEHRPDPLERWGWLTPLVPAVVTLLAMYWGIRGTSLWRDEAATITMAQRPWSSFVGTLGRIDAVHTLYYLLMRPVVATFGISETAVRMPSVLAMTLAAAFTALLGRRLVSARAGLFAGVLLATAFPMITKYTQEARSYPFVTMLAVLSTYLLVRAVEQRTTAAYAAYGAATALAGLTHLFALPLLLVHAIALVPLRRDRGLVTRWLVTAAAVVLVTAPLLIVSQGQSGQVSWITRPDGQTFWELVTGFGGSNWTLLPILVLVGTGLLAGPGRSALDLRWLLPVWALLPPVLFVGVSMVHPVYLFRYVLYCIPPVALLAGIGLDRLRWRYALPVGLVVLLIGFPAQRDVRTIYAKADDLRKLARVLRAHEQPGDAIVFHHSIYSRVMVAYPDAFRPLKDIAFGRSAYAINSLQRNETDAATFTQRLASVDRVWYVDTSTTYLDPLDATKQRLVVDSGDFVRSGRWKYHGGTLYLYVRR